MAKVLAVQIFLKIPPPFLVTHRLQYCVSQDCSEIDDEI
jgi:hypothetical protein